MPGGLGDIGIHGVASTIKDGNEGVIRGSVLRDGHLIQFDHLHGPVTPDCNRTARIPVADPCIRLPFVEPLPLPLPQPAPGAHRVLFRDEPIALFEGMEDLRGDKLNVSGILRELMPGVLLVPLARLPVDLKIGGTAEIERLC